MRRKKNKSILYKIYKTIILLQSVMKQNLIDITDRANGFQKNKNADNDIILTIH